MLTYEDAFSSPKVMKGWLNRLPVPSTALSDAYGKGIGAKGTVEAPAPGSFAMYEIFDSTRTMAKGRAIDVRPNLISPRPTAQRFVKPLHFAEGMPFHFNRMMDKRGLGQPIGTTDNGGSYILENVSQLKIRLGNSFEFMWAQTLLGTGFKYETTPNNDYVLRPSTYAGDDQITVVTSELPASHLDQLAVDVGGADIIDESWDDPTANIFGQLMRLDVAIARESGLPVSEFWMNGITASHLFNNTGFRQIIGNQAPIYSNLGRQGNSLNNSLAAYEFRLAALPNIRFVIYNGVVTIGDYDYVSYEDAITEAYSTLIIPTGRVIMTPPRETVDQWAGFVPVKRTIVESGKKEVKREAVVGLDAYSYLTDHPAGIVENVSHGGLPFIKLPRAVFAPTVIFT